MPLRKKKKTPQEEHKIFMEDRNRKQQEGREKVFEIFKEVAGNKEKEIEKFLETYKSPEKEILDFVDKYELNLIESEAPLVCHKQALEYIRLRDKYGFVFTSAIYEDFCYLMRREYYLDFELKTITNVNLNLELVEMLMKAASEIDLEDAQVYGLFKNRGMYGIDWNWQIIDNKAVIKMILDKLPQDLEYAKNYKLEWNVPDIQELQAEFGYGEDWDPPVTFSRGEFQVIQVDSDPIIIANLTPNIYKVLGYARTLPEVGKFKV